MTDTCTEDPFRTVYRSEPTFTLVEYPVEILRDDGITKIGYREFKDYAQLIVQHKGVVEEEVITPRDIQPSSLPLEKLVEKLEKDIIECIEWRLSNG